MSINPATMTRASAFYKLPSEILYPIFKEFVDLGELGNNYPDYMDNMQIWYVIDCHETRPFSELIASTASGECQPIGLSRIVALGLLPHSM